MLLHPLAGHTDGCLRLKLMRYHTAILRISLAEGDHTTLLPTVTMAPRACTLALSNQDKRLVI